MNKLLYKHFTITSIIGLITSVIFIVGPSENVFAGTSDGQDLALAILANQSTLISSSYSDQDVHGNRQATVLSSLGTMLPTDGSNFTILSTGIAGAVPVTTDTLNPGDERGTSFKGNKHGYPRDEATLEMILQVPPYMHYLYYDIQFFSAEYPEFIGSQYNDRLTVTVESPSKGITSYTCDVNGGDFILDANDIPGTGFDIFATSGNPILVDWVDTTPRTPGADAGSTALITREHAVSPNEQITVTFNIIDTGDNQFDSAVFIDNLIFSGLAKTEILARKTVEDINGGFLECGDVIEYRTTISNIGTANQSDNPGNEFEDFIPDNTTYVLGSETATSGVIEYNAGENKVIWNGEISSESSVALTFHVTVNDSLFNGTIISNQGTVYWDSNEDGTNDATELTDDSAADDGIDQDGDGETDDDDPTTAVVYSYEPPPTVTEDFSDDVPGGNATQYYYIYEWFETTEVLSSSHFKVASTYYYSTAQSFKTQLRSPSSPQYWYYDLSAISSDIDWWEIWFACGNASEPYDLILEFKNDEDNDIAKIKFEYVHRGLDPLTDYVIELYYWSPSTGWNRLRSDYTMGYLFNDWYKLRIEKNGASNINYSLYQNGKGLVDSKIAGQLGSPFANFEKIEWSTTKNPVVCPMFFWDEHKLGLHTIT